VARRIIRAAMAGERSVHHAHRDRRRRPGITANRLSGFLSRTELCRRAARCPQAMTTAAEYRQFATECVVAARSAASPEAFNNVSGIGRGGTGVLKVDGKEVARQSMEHTIPLIMQWDDNFDIGDDTGTPVSNDYQVPFKFNGTIDKLTLTIDRPKLSPADIEKLKQATRNNRAAE
jgi:hypothetical protein